MEISMSRGDALIVVDVQKDFCPGGALPIDGGDAVVPVLNRCVDIALANDVPIYASRDWHPSGHVSFAEQGGPWPAHCVQDTDGAGFHPDLSLPGHTVMVTKGVRFDRDQNSAFDGTGLEIRLRQDAVQRLFVGGLAEDVCVLATVRDGCAHGFTVVLIENATRPVTVRGGEAARADMRKMGVLFHKVG